MGIKGLEFTLSNLNASLVERLGRLSQGAPNAKQTLEICRIFRRIGCGHLLAQLDRERFTENLFRSAEMYLMLLSIQHELQEQDRYYLARSRGEPLLDALCISAVPLAREIGSSMVDAWMPDAEDEEDFLYFKLLPALLGTGTALPASDVERLEALKEELDTPRLRAVHALVDAKSREFEEALAALTDDWQGAIEEGRQSGPVDPYHDRTEANLFIEGAALVRVARLREMKTWSQYPFIPEALLQEPPPPLPRKLVDEM